jgi:porin
VGISLWNDRNEVACYFDVELTGKGFRQADRGGIAFSHAPFADVFSRLSTREGANTTTRAESLIELTYEARLSRWMSPQPDFQYILGPQDARAADVLVAGLRCKLIF